MIARGRVRVWYDEQGWGVIDSDAAPGGCWAHFSSVLFPERRSPVPGEEVDLELEPAQQDGYAFRAVDVWPAGTERVDHRTVITEPTEAYRSSLTISFDDEDD